MHQNAEQDSAVMTYFSDGLVFNILHQQQLSQVSVIIMVAVGN